MTEIMQCGCPLNDHLAGCWMAEVEQVAHLARDQALAGGTSIIVAIVTALVEGGWLRDPDVDGELEEMLDALVEVGLLDGDPAPVGGEQ